jgi:hypothetical protein
VKLGLCHCGRNIERRVLRRIFGLKRDEVVGGWRKLHNEDLHNLYPSQKMGRACSTHMGEEECIGKARRKEATGKN